MTGCMDVFALTDGKLALTENLFDHDALVVEKNQTDTVALCRRDGSRYLTVTMQAPLFGVWSPMGKDVPFGCIGPGQHLQDREWGNRTAPGQVWKASYVIEV